MAIQRQTDKGKPTIRRRHPRFMVEGLDGLLHEATRPAGKPPLPPAVIERVIDMSLAEPPGRDNPLDRSGDSNGRSLPPRCWMSSSYTSIRRSTRLASSASRSAGICRTVATNDAGSPDPRTLPGAPSAVTTGLVKGLVSVLLCYRFACRRCCGNCGPAEIGTLAPKAAVPRDRDLARNTLSTHADRGREDSRPSRE
jgi:hypothetical protein